MGHWLRLTNAPFRNFEKILNLRNESASFALMNSEKPTALAAGFRAVREFVYEICIVIAIYVKAAGNGC